MKALVSRYVFNSEDSKPGVLTRLLTIVVAIAIAVTCSVGCSGGSDDDRRSIILEDLEKTGHPLPTERPSFEETRNEVLGFIEEGALEDPEDFLDAHSASPDEFLYPYWSFLTKSEQETLYGNSSQEIKEVLDEVAAYFDGYSWEQYFIDFADMQQPEEGQFDQPLTVLYGHSFPTHDLMFTGLHAFEDESFFRTRDTPDEHLSQETYNK